MNNRTWSMRAEALVGEIDIYGPIGASMFEEDGVTAKQFIADLQALGQVDEIDLRIYSPGGSMMEGNAIFNALVQHPASIRVFIDFAASMAGVIAMAADPGKLIMAENGFLMLHNPSSVAMGDADEMRKTADLLDKFKATAIPAYQRHAKLSAEEISKMMDAETWLTAVEARQHGFISMISPEIRVAASIIGGAGMKNAPEAAMKFFAPAPVAETVEPTETVEPIADPAVEPVAIVKPIIEPVSLAMPAAPPLVTPAEMAHVELLALMRERDTEVTAAKAALATAKAELETAERRIESMTAGFAYRPEPVANARQDLQAHPYFQRMAELTMSGLTNAQASAEIDKTDPSLRADLIRRANQK